MPSIKGRASRWVSDDFPGWIEFSFRDADGRDWRVVEKEVFFHGNAFTSTSDYPVTALLDCDEMSREARGDGVVTVRVSLRGTDTVEGLADFDLTPDQLLFE